MFEASWIDLNDSQKWCSVFFIYQTVTFTAFFVEREIEVCSDFRAQTFWENVGPSSSIWSHPDFGQARVERVHQTSAGPEQKLFDRLVIESVKKYLKVWKPILRCFGVINLKMAPFSYDWFFKSKFGNMFESIAWIMSTK